MAQITDELVQYVGDQVYAAVTEAVDKKTADEDIAYNDWMLDMFRPTYQPATLELIAGPAERRGFTPAQRRRFIRVLDAWGHALCDEWEATPNSQRKLLDKEVKAAWAIASTVRAVDALQREKGL